MHEALRPDPDALLAAVQREEAHAQRGKLKIFFGMCAGVGKTYAMLQAAQALRAQGVHVVAGYVETHGRAETQALLQNLPLVPRLKIPYRGVEVEELDLDALLALRPAYVLVDELAHTNLGGTRHRKRYQDVLELLDHGIHVYTTLNVQHVESLIDAVQQITGITVSETVPDSILDRADEIELLDLPPEELLKRLAEGKVYAPERSHVAMQNFFRKGNLTALREMVLRKTAERVGMDLQEYMRTHRIEGPWKTTERLMVAVGASPFSEQLIRWTRRLAATMEAPWVATYVQTPHPRTASEEQCLKHNLALAIELGAELVTTSDDNVAHALLRVAQQKNVTQIVVGKPPSPSLWERLRRNSLVEQLLAQSGNIDVHVVQGAVQPDAPKPRRQAQRTASLTQYIQACGFVLMVSAFCYIARDLIDYRAVGMFLLFAVSLLALFVGRGPIFAAAALSAFMWNFFFIPPLFTFHISVFADALMLGMYFIIALVGGELTARIRSREVSVRRREQQTAALFHLAQELNRAQSLDDMLRALQPALGNTFNAQVATFLTQSKEQLNARPHATSTFTPSSEKEWSVASWVYQNRRPAGRGTNTLPFAEAIYYPLATASGIVGVIGLAPLSKQPFTIEQENLLQTFLYQIGIALEREVLRAAAEHTRVLAASEHLYKTLLNSISHELRTPLATITGAATSLQESGVAEDSARRSILVRDIFSAGARLNRLVRNLLDMTRLESGLLKLHMEWCDVHDLIHVTLQHLATELAGHRLALQLAESAPLVRMDFVLMEQVLSNLLLNAAQHTPQATTITIRTAAVAQRFMIVIEDEGEGFPPEALEHIFEKFYRLPQARTGGTGLGLSIARGFVQAHGGSIHAENRLAKGARFIVQLPLTAAPHTAEEPEA